MDDLKKILKSVLISSPAKLQAYQLNEDFKLYVGKNIPFEKYGYKNLLAFLHSLSDILIVRGNDLFSPVELKFPNSTTCTRVIKRPRRRRRKKKKLSKPENGVASTSNKVISSNKPSTSGININMRLYRPSEELRMAMRFDAKMAFMRERIEKFNRLEEHKDLIETQNNEKQELRYPKTAINSNKNVETLDLDPWRNLQAGPSTTYSLEKISFQSEAEKSKILEYIRTRMNIARRLKHLPGKKTVNSVPTDKLVDLSDDFLKCVELPIPARPPVGTSASLTILDEPVPAFIPDISKEFTKTKSDDLIDFDDFVQTPLAPTVVPPLKAIPFMEVIKMLENLKISQ